MNITYMNNISIGNRGFITASILVQIIVISIIGLILSGKCVTENKHGNNGGNNVQDTRK